MKKKKSHRGYYALIFIAVLVVALVFAKDILNLTGFAIFQDDFVKNLQVINGVNGKYNTNLYNFPLTIEEDFLLLNDLKAIKNIDELANPFRLLLDFRIKLVESDIFYKEGWKYGKGSTTEYGFGCKGLERIRNATFHRNMSSLVGYQAINIAQDMIDNYPEEAEIANVTQKHLLFLNAPFRQEEQDATRDRRVIEKLCVKG